jgi:branched-chain amino acid transport system permease protein
MQFLIFGIILVAMMLLRPQGLVPSRVRAQELKHAAVEESVFDARVEAKEA